MHKFSFLQFFLSVFLKCGIFFYKKGDVTIELGMKGLGLSVWLCSIFIAFVCNMCVYRMCPIF